MLNVSSTSTNCEGQSYPEQPTSPATDGKETKLRPEDYVNQDSGMQSEKLVRITLMITLCYKHAMRTSFTRRASKTCWVENIKGLLADIEWCCNVSTVPLTPKHSVPKLSDKENPKSCLSRTPSKVSGNILACTI